MSGHGEQLLDLRMSFKAILNTILSTERQRSGIVSSREQQLLQEMAARQEAALGETRVLLGRGPP